MSRGHGIIINLSSFFPFVFEFNPTEVNSEKKINYVEAPNIGGSHKTRYFTGFDSKEVSFKLMCVDMQGPLGVKPQIDYFEALRNPDPGLFGLFSSIFGNENYPPPQILFWFGTGLVPLVWDVLDVRISATHFMDGHITGIWGIPKKAEIDLKLALVEDHILNKANRIAETAGYIAGSVESVVREAKHKINDNRKERLFKLPVIKKGW